MDDIEKVLEILNSFRRTEHDYCEDCWYSCPAHPEEYCGIDDTHTCNCGLDDNNERVDKAIRLISSLWAEGN